MLMYGSSFCMVTRRPRILSKRPSEAPVSPLPSELATPPVTKMCFGIQGLPSNDNHDGISVYRHPARGPANDHASHLRVREVTGVGRASTASPAHVRGQS